MDFTPSWYVVDNPALILTTFRQDQLYPSCPCRARGHIPIGEMSALRKLKRRFVLETRPDDNFIKTIVSPREKESCRAARDPQRCRIFRGRFQLSTNDVNLSRRGISGRLTRMLNSEPFFLWYHREVREHKCIRFLKDSIWYSLRFRLCRLCLRDFAWEGLM